MRVVEAILTTALNGASKTHIVYRANLNFKICQRYLKDLESKGLLMCIEDSAKRYTTTEKGSEFLDQYSKIKELL
ncbi:MAG: transcriptional regulator [Candidatus Verstraetearchaeota archaeon]|nr:transcriptional regulator [Candidatus Verstraetearchaeota archaeon]